MTATRCRAAFTKLRHTPGLLIVQKMVRRIRQSLAPAGRMVLLEFRGEDPEVPIRPEHKMTVAQVKAEIEPEGFRLDRVMERLPRQHILVFRRSVQ